MENNMGNEASDDKEMNDLKKQLEKLKMGKDISEAEKAIAEAKKAIFKAELPESEIKALEGKITVDDNVAIECQILSYKAMSEIAFQISDELKKAGTKRVVVYNQNEFNMALSYRIFIKQLELFQKQYEILLEEKVATKMTLVNIGTAITAGTAVVKSFADLISLLRVDVDIKGKKVDLVDESLIAEVARALKSKEIITILPAFINTEADILLETISKLSESKENASKKIEEWGSKSEFADKVAKLKNLNTQYEKILTVLTSIDEKTGMSILEKLIKGEMIDKELNTSDTDVLYLKIISAGGNNRVKRSLFWSNLSHSGSAIITYFLLDKKGVIKASKTFYNFIGYKQFKNEKINNFNS